MNGGVARQAEPGSGAISPVSKPGTPVPGGGGSAFQGHAAPRTASSQLPTNLIDRLSSQEIARTASSTARAAANITPGKERPVPGAAAMKKACSSLDLVLLCYIF